jgi:hypothetical protein
MNNDEQNKKIKFEYIPWILYPDTVSLAFLAAILLGLCEAWLDFPKNDHLAFGILIGMIIGCIHTKIRHSEKIEDKKIFNRVWKVTPEHKREPKRRL